jgi:hypothetical protein
MLERSAKDPQAFIPQQGWASFPLDGVDGLKELRSLYEPLQARILERIELRDEVRDELRSSAEMEIHREAEQDESVIDRVVAAQRKELEAEIGTLHAEAEQIAEEARELAGEVPF